MKIKLSTDKPLTKSSAIISLILGIASSAGLVLEDIWTDMPEQLMALLPEGQTAVIAAISFFLIFIARCTAIVKE